MIRAYDRQRNSQIRYTELTMAFSSRWVQPRCGWRMSLESANARWRYVRRAREVVPGSRWYRRPVPASEQPIRQWRCANRHAALARRSSGDASCRRRSARPVPAHKKRGTDDRSRPDCLWRAVQRTRFVRRRPRPAASEAGTASVRAAAPPRYRRRMEAPPEWQDADRAHRGPAAGTALCAAGPDPHPVSRCY